MAARTTRAELDELATLVDRALRLPAGSHSVSVAYGRPRLVRGDGAYDISPRLPAGQLADWMRAYHAGIIAAGTITRSDPYRALCYMLGCPNTALDGSIGCERHRPTDENDD
jgi:hypothetical protein